MKTMRDLYQVSSFFFFFRTLLDWLVAMLTNLSLLFLISLILVIFVVLTPCTPCVLRCSFGLNQNLLFQPIKRNTIVLILIGFEVVCIGVTVFFFVGT